MRPDVMDRELLLTLRGACALGSVLVLLGCLPALWRGVLFAWHPALMSVGFLSFMTEGLITARELRPTEGAVRVARLWHHAKIQCAAALCVLLGFYAIWENKRRNGKAHLTSLHGKLGAVTLALALGSPLGGAVSFRAVGLLPRLPLAWHPTIKWAHRWGGALAWHMALVTMAVVVPHKAVLLGVSARVFQLALASAGACMLSLLRTLEKSLPVVGKAGS